MYEGREGEGLIIFKHHGRVNEWQLSIIFDMIYDYNNLQKKRKKVQNKNEMSQVQISGPIYLSQLSIVILGRLTKKILRKITSSTNKFFGISLHIIIEVLTIRFIAKIPTITWHTRV